MKTKEEVLEFLLAKLRENGIDLNSTLVSRMKRASENENALPDSVLDFLNSNLNSIELPVARPSWLNDVDRFLDETTTTSDPRLHPFQLRRFLPEVIALLAPILSLEKIFSLRSFDVDFVSSLELAFMTRLELPRNVSEAKRLYEFILAQPSSAKTSVFKKHSKYGAPYFSQMIFVVLIMRDAEPGSALWEFQLQCLKTCPTHLLAYGDISKEGISYRPSFWMAHFVTDDQFRKVILDRASKQYQVDLKNVLDFDKSRDDAKQALAVDDDEYDKTTPLLERVTGSQAELASILMNLDELLKKDHPDIFASLNPGASSNKIEKLNEAVAPLKLPEDFATLYKWHDGVENGKFVFGFPEILSTQSALQEYRDSIELFSDTCWCKAWFTIAYESRVYLLIPLSESTQQTAPVFYYDIENGEILIHHAGTKEFIKSYIDAYSDGIVSDEESGHWEFDEVKFDDIRMKHSPDAYRYDKNESETEAICYDSNQSSNWPSEWKKYQVGKCMD